MTRRSRTRRRRRVTGITITAAVAVGLIITGGGAGAVVAVVYLVSLTWGLTIAYFINAVVNPPRPRRRFRPLEPLEYVGPGSWSPFVGIPDES